MKKKRKSLRVASAALVCAMTATSVLPAAAAKKNEETTPTVPTEQTECSKSECICNLPASAEGDVSTNNTVI